jgi:hypothetical protein
MYRFKKIVWLLFWPLLLTLAPRIKKDFLLLNSIVKVPLGSLAQANVAAACQTQA